MVDIVHLSRGGGLVGPSCPSGAGAGSLLVLDRGGRAGANAACHQTARIVGKAIRAASEKWTPGTVAAFSASAAEKSAHTVPEAELEAQTESSVSGIWVNTASGTAVTFR